MMYGYGTGMTWWMVLYSVVWFILIAAAITAIVIWIRNTSAPASAPPNPRHILDERLARGEIDTDEYQRRISVLSQPASGMR